MSCKYLYSVALLVLCLNPVPAIEIGEPAPELGTILELKNGQRMQLLAEGMQVKAFFIDTEGKVAKTNADSIVLVIEDPGHKNDKWRGFLKKDNENGFVCTKRLYPPYEFRARIIVRFTDEDPISFAKKAIDLDKAVSQAVSDDI